MRSKFIGFIVAIGILVEAALSLVIINEVTIQNIESTSDIFNNKEVTPLIIYTEDTLAQPDSSSIEENADDIQEPTPIAAEDDCQETYIAETYCDSRSGLNPISGVNYYDGWRETYYSSNVLYHYRTPEWSVDENGVYRDSDGYVVVASSSDDQGTIINTSFGLGKVYDTGCAVGTHDIYTNW